MLPVKYRGITPCRVASIHSQVCDRGLQYGDIIACVAEHGVATIAQQAAYLACLVVMVEAQPAPSGATADGANATLFFQHRQVFGVGNAMLALTPPAHDLHNLALSPIGAITVLGAVTKTAR